MTSLKKLIAVLAVSLPFMAAAQTAPAAAAPPPLAQIYGTLNVNFGYEEAPSAANRAQDVKGRYGLSIDSTNIGVRGTLDTGRYGLGVVYQCETTARVDGVGASNSTGFVGICDRNSRLGLSSPYGTLFYGNWDTPYKAAWYGTKADDVFGNTDVFDSESIMGSPGFNTKTSAGVTGGNSASAFVIPPTFGPATGSISSSAAPTTTAFAVRAADSVAYWTPKFMGLSAKVQYSGSRFGDTRMVRVPELVSAVVNYDKGPLSVFAAAEDHEDWQTPRSRDYGWKVGAGYELGSPFGTTTLGAVYEQLRYNAYNGTSLITITGVGTVREFDRPAFMVNLKHRMGNHEFRARYEYADAGSCKTTAAGTCSTAGFGAKDYALGYAYYLAASTQLFAYWTQIDNARNAQYTFGTGGFSAIAGATAPGADPWAVGLGMRYAF